VVYRNPQELVPYERNSRQHSPEQIAKIRASIREFGFTNPILLKDDEQTIGAGHARCQASLLEKLKRVPTITLRGLSEEQWRAYVIADNQLAITGSSWDEAMLKLELSDLQAEGFDLSLTGFSSLELTGIFSTQEGNTDPDEVPTPLGAPVSRLGDLWHLGEHRVICGDCTNKETVERLLEGRKPHLCTTDIPYGVDYDPAWRSKALKDGGRRAEGLVANDHRADWREAFALFPGDVIYVWHDAANPMPTQLALEACGFEIRSQIIWRKSGMAVGRGHYHWAHEACFYAVRKGANGHWSGSRKESTVWDIESPKRSETGHGTQKPVECMARPMRNNAAPGDLVFDGFLGSGSSLVAAHLHKRVLFGCELMPAYVDVACTRFAAFTGVVPVLVETGETFEEVKARRLEVV